MAETGYLKIDLCPYYDTRCWGCGSQLVPSSLYDFLKCTWCGAITDQNRHLRKVHSPGISMWMQLRDRLLVTSSILFMSGVTCSAVWAVLPVISSLSYNCWMFHCIVMAILSITTPSSFYLASTTPAEEPSNMPRGNRMLVARDGLNYYSFCTHCSKPKPPGAEHCHSCNKCVLDRHCHCPFIGNCVGAANLPHFITFLISVIVSCTYIVIMTSYGACHQWPAIDMRHIITNAIFSRQDVTGVLAEIVFAFAGSAKFLSLRVTVLIYLLLMCLVLGGCVTWYLFDQVLDIGCDGEINIKQIISSYGDLCSRTCWKLSDMFRCPHSLYRITHCSKTGKRWQT